MNKKSKKKIKPWRISRLFRCIKNYFFCFKYPFYKVYHRWTGKFCGYNYTEYDSINSGWRIAFGKQLSKEIKKTLLEDISAHLGNVKNKRFKVWKTYHFKCKDYFYFTDIKEKWGVLRLYATTTSNVYKVLSKYEKLSQYYCIDCGEKAEYLECSIYPLCYNCFVNYVEASQFKTEDEFYDYMESCEIKEEDSEK